MSEDLSRFTVEELTAELERRRAQQHRDAGKDWYFFHLDEEEIGIPAVGIAHKRYWHRHHSLFSNGLSLVLPEGLFEASESVFEYEGTREEVEQRLTSFGYTALPEPYKWQQALVVHLCTIGGIPYSIDCKCDTPELRAIFSSQAKKDMEFVDLDAYRTWAQLLAPDAVFEFFNPYSSGASACFMRREVAESLPAYPEDMHD
ncbi:MAG: hypothetical protein Q8P82_00250 [bacterium]|nr:hypothetical protein [bacterium]